MPPATKPNPHDFPREEDAEHLEDRGDVLTEEEEEEEEEQPEKPAKKAAKKVVKKKAKAEEEEEEEPDEEEEEEPDEEEEEDEEDEDADKNKAGTVPLHVLKRSQQKRRQAEERLRALEDKLNQQSDDATDRQKAKFEKTVARMEELYEQVEEARAEGRTKDAAKLQRELDGIRSDMTRAEAAYHATKQALAQQNHVAYNALVSELEVIDPRFDENADEFDDDLVERTSELTEAYEAKGLSAPEALRKALRMILGEDPFRTGRRLQKEEPKKKAAPRKTDVAKNLETKKKTPPEDKQGSLEKKSSVNPLKLSDEDFDKLPEATKRRIRGDFPEEEG